MVNSNPETVSTDYDTSDKLYFEPLTREDVLAIVDREKPDGVIVQLGGQTPLTLAVGLEKAGVPIIGTSPDSIDRAEDRKRFSELVNKLGLRQPENGTAVDVAAGAWPRRTTSATRCWCGPATCWAAGPWRSSTTMRASRTTWSAPSGPPRSGPS